MPDIGSFHPQIVHFVVALMMVGVAMRVVSLTGKLRFTNPAATTLILLGAAASVLAVESGTDAHGPVERIPGARAAVIEHEEAAELARNIFLGLAAIEVLALGLARGWTAARYVRFAHIASAVVGVAGGIALYRAAELGGELVYSYAGGPGLRTGDPEDVRRVLLAGLYLQSQADRKAGRHADAADLVRTMRQRYGSDTTVRFLYVESLLRDAKDYAGAKAALDSIGIPPNDTRLQARKGLLAADIYVAEGRPDSARAVLEALLKASPANSRLRARLDSIR